jgi:hypothetical protein
MSRVFLLPPSPDRLPNPHFLGDGKKSDCVRVSVTGREVLRNLAAHSRPENIDRVRRGVGYTNYLSNFRKIVATLKRDSLISESGDELIITARGRAQVPVSCHAQPVRPVVVRVTSVDKPLSKKYNACEMAKNTMREGALDLLQCPSLFCGVRKARVSPLLTSA